MKFTSAISAIALIVFAQAVTATPTAALSSATTTSAAASTKSPSVPSLIGASITIGLVETEENPITFFVNLGKPNIQASVFNLLAPGQEEAGNKRFNLTIIDLDTGDITTLTGTGALQETS
jgi:hypothetical protein